MTAGIDEAPGYQHGDHITDTQKPAVSERPHGYARYKLNHCRCDVCKDARRKYDRKQIVLAANGKSATVDAEPVREHIRALQTAGLGTRRISQLSGVGRTALNKLLNGCPSRGTGPSRRVLAATAEKLLAVRPALDHLAGKALVDPTGAQRRLQALVALGWSQAELAKRIGWTPSNFGSLIHGTYGHVIADTARAVIHLYAELCEATPDDPTGRSRRYAAARGWTPPIGWDDDTIDDPNAHPNMTGYDEETVRALLAGEAVECELVDIAEAARRGRSVPVLAAQLGINQGTLYYRLRTNAA